MLRPRSRITNSNGDGGSRPYTVTSHQLVPKQHVTVGKRQLQRCFVGGLEVTFSVTEMLTIVFLVLLEYTQTCHRSGCSTVNDESALAKIETQVDNFHGLAVGVNVTVVDDHSIPVPLLA